jgi:glycosyltransferase involved in cell wall biosynthesis
MTHDERVSLLLAESGTSVGGAERVVWELATRLPADRFAVRVWLSDAPGVDELAESLAERELPVDRVASVDSRWDWGGMLAAWSRLRRQRPALLHLHHVRPVADRHLASLALAAGVPHLVVTEHAVGRSRPAAQRTMQRPDLQRADAVTAVCGAVADALVRDYGVERARVRVVGNGADLPDEERERPIARRLRDDLGAGQFRPLWVCAARLEDRKGHAVLLEALAKVQARGLDFIVVLAGEGSLRADLEARVAAAGLGDRVRFFGQVDAVGPLLLAADACVLPSLWEALPLTLLEALARGRPVVASQVGGVPEVIEDGVNGRLVPAGDGTALAAVLEDFHRRPDAARHLGRAGADRVRAEFTWPRVVSAFEAVYDEVLGLASFAPERGRDRRSGSRRGAR